MARSPLLGRRIHIAGSISKDPSFASLDDVAVAREMVSGLVRALMKLGATFVVPVDAEPKRDDGQPICFDWLVWQTIRDTISTRPASAPVPLAVAVQHHKNEDQIPEEFHALWDEMRDSPVVRMESAARWNMNSKRMEVQARYGDILIALGGNEGVRFLADLYHAAGKPVIPLNLPITSENEGSRRLYSFGEASGNSRKLFQIANGGDSHDWINRIRFPARQSVQDRVTVLVGLLESLERPRAFAVRLLAPDHNEFAAVQGFFDTVVQPVIEGDLGYRLTVIDGRQAYDHARIDDEIFAKLHRASVVVADITGSRPNCFLELGYALGRSIPTIVTARDGSDTPFDIKTLAGHHWKTDGTAEDRRKAFREHWEAVRNRPPLVTVEELIA
ncbi:hypothetical protein FJQ54_15955 [Sandaracinobacter neustonicus]|uniref:ATP nucleosidase Cap17-like N-terminal domain-containing protein n=1 Tax=Sandaracinobacter neustonicus TaxID=1715348 RepID=A0A501XD89_9SPHN|nr:hypothetical protein [Sandaracinobacter neustonicus]TPE58555.1 hypothetical protein FJQ54_15955 [Sandaracinobacter neustonicus]